MADEPAPESKTQKRPSELYISYPAPERLSVPEPASKVLAYSAGGNEFKYQARAGHLDVRSNAGQSLSQMFALSFVRLKGQEPDPQRPVTFAYNGGPGCCSVPVDFGGFGPLKVKSNGIHHLDAYAPLEQNPYSFLPFTDLVFLDAPGTGFSTVAEDADPKKIFGVDGDADAFCRAIMRWLEENDRWESPVYLLGESYGTVRNAVLMRKLGEASVKVTGVTMLSSIFDFVQADEGEDLYYLGMVPSFAATAHYFKKAGQGVEEDEWFDQAVAWDEDVYAPALLKGDRISQEQQQRVADEMSGFIGLPADLIMRNHLRIKLDCFRKNLLRDEGKVIGRLDMRFTSAAPLATQDSSDWFAGEDAADDANDANMVSAFRNFLRSTLGYKNPAVYLGSNYEGVGTKWNWTHLEPGTMYPADTPNVSLDIAVALKRNPTMKISFLGGRYDAATTYWNTVHDMSCLYLPEDLKQRIEFHRYGCGHMAYIDLPTLKQIYKDEEKFYQKR